MHIFTFQEFLKAGRNCMQFSSSHTEIFAFFSKALILIADGRPYGRKPLHYIANSFHTIVDFILKLQRQ